MKGNPSERPDFLMKIRGVFPIDGRGTVLTGRVAAGSVKTGDIVSIDAISPSIGFQVHAIEMNRKLIDVAHAGSDVGIMLEVFDATIFAPGMFAASHISTDADTESTHEPLEAPPTRAVYRGRNCALTVTKRYLSISHFLKPTVDCTVPLESVSASHFEPATRLTAGILTISTEGRTLVVPTGTQVGSDPRTVVFQRRSNETFLEVHRWLLGLISRNGF